MKIAIVDDNKTFVADFLHIIKGKWHTPPAKLDTFYDAESFLSSKESYDVIFLDIEIPDMSGIKIAQNFDADKSIIIFVSRRDDLVFEAYNTTNALGFIRKSHLEEDLNIVIDRISRNHQNTLYFNLKRGNSIIKIKYSDVIYIEKIAKDIVIYTTTKTFTTRKSITEVEKELNPYGFIRTHAGFIVNLAYIELINPANALLKNGKSVPISRQKLKYVKDMFLERNVMLNE